MITKYINPTCNAYSQAIEVKNYKRMVFVSGHIPADIVVEIPIDFRSQCELVWKNIEQQLKGATMKLTNIVKITTYLSDNIYREENHQVRKSIFGSHEPALTVLITGAYDENWLLQIEVIAAE
jgi:2-iminobutanoate/2-iminopropanoate deaminase